MVQGLIYNENPDISSSEITGSNFDVALLVAFTANFLSLQ
jgi:hypothetical protein